jgi:hypothetical protein
MIRAKNVETREGKKRWIDDFIILKRAGAKLPVPFFQDTLFPQSHHETGISRSIFLICSKSLALVGVGTL